MFRIPDRNVQTLPLFYFVSYRYLLYNNNIALYHLTDLLLLSVSGSHFDFSSDHWLTKCFPIILFFVSE